MRPGVAVTVIVTGGGQVVAVDEVDIMLLLGELEEDIAALVELVIIVLE